MLSVDTQTLAVLLNKAARGRFGLDKANQIQQTAKNSFGIILASSSFALIIRQYLEQLKSLESSVAVFDAEIARIMDNFDTKLESITGVGKTLAAVIFSEIGGDIKKFSSVPKLVAYAGIYPKSRQSGESKTDGRITSVLSEKVASPTPTGNTLCNSKVNQLELDSAELKKALVTGRVEDISQVVVAGQKAEIALQFTLQLRNRAVSAYQEMMRMQV